MRLLSLEASPPLYAKSLGGHAEGAIQRRTQLWAHAPQFPRQILVISLFWRKCSPCFGQMPLSITIASPPQLLCFRLTASVIYCQMASVYLLPRGLCYYSIAERPQSYSIAKWPQSILCFRGRGQGRRFLLTYLLTYLFIH